MPNHCTNRLIIHGPKEEVDALVALMRGESAFDFNKVDPCPQELRDTSADIGTPSDRQKANRKKYGHEDWYSWQTSHWGTKWNAYSISAAPPAPTPLELLAEAHHDEERAERQVEYEFYTAWAPPTPVIEHLSRMFPKCSVLHQYVEEGCYFSGEVLYESGEEVGSDIRGIGEDLYSISDWHEKFRGDVDEDEDEDEEDEP